MIADTPEARRAFILANTRLQRPPHCPEIALHLADEVTPIWRMTEAALERIGLPPPFWAFAWAGGQGLARWLLDNPHEVAGRQVVDFATGSGLVAIAALTAGAAAVLASDVDPFCAEAVGLNAAANGVAVGFTGADLLDAPAAFSRSDPGRRHLLRAAHDRAGAGLAACRPGCGRPGAGRRSGAAATSPPPA